MMMESVTSGFSCSCGGADLQLRGGGGGGCSSFTAGGGRRGSGPKAAGGGRLSDRYVSVLGGWTLRTMGNIGIIET